MTANSAPRFVRLLSCAAISLSLVGCGGGDDKPKEEPKVEKEKPKLPERPKEVELNPEKKLDLSGPKAPEASTVFFAVDGALVPIACWDKDSGKMSGGPDCAKGVNVGEEVYVYAEHTKDIDVIGGPKNSLCEVTDNPTSRSAKSVDAGAAYEFAVWPKAAHNLIKATKAKSREERTLQWDSEETEALTKKINELKPAAAKGEFRPWQKAELDLEGDGKNEIFYAVVVAHPSDPDRNLFAGLLMAPGGDMGALTLIDQAKRHADVMTLSGAVDLDGDGKFDPWTTLTFDGGSGDRVVQMVDGKPKPLSKFSCGV